MNSLTAQAATYIGTVPDGERVLAELNTNRRLDGPMLSL